LAILVKNQTRIKLVGALTLIGLAILPQDREVRGAGWWHPAASLTLARSAHTATVLQNGRILVVGGFGALNSAEIYDPSSDTWSLAASLTVGRAYHRATLLKDGRVLVTGGTPDLVNAIGSAEIYDPIANAWTSAGSLPNAVWVHSSTLLPTGEVLVTGGHNSTGSLTATELYDPLSNSWSTIGSMTFAREGHSATVLADGRVLIAGGHDGFNYVALAEIFDPITKTWSGAGTMVTARNQHSATLLGDGRVLVAGGFGSVSGIYVVLATSELFDPHTSSWSVAASLPAPRATAQDAVLLPNGEVLRSGGTDVVGYQPQTDAELYNVATDTWTNAGSMANGRVTHSAVLLADGRVLTIGGGDISHEINGVEIFALPGVGGASRQPDLPPATVGHGSRPYGSAGTALSLFAALDRKSVV